MLDWRDGNGLELQEEMAIARGTILRTTELNIHERLKRVSHYGSAVTVAKQGKFIFVEARGRKGSPGEDQVADPLKLPFLPREAVSSIRVCATSM